MFQWCLFHMTSLYWEVLSNHQYVEYVDIVWRPFNIFNVPCDSLVLIALAAFTLHQYIDDLIKHLNIGCLQCIDGIIKVNQWYLIVRFNISSHLSSRFENASQVQPMRSIIVVCTEICFTRNYRNCQWHSRLGAT